MRLTITNLSDYTQEHIALERDGDMGLRQKAEDLALTHSVRCSFNDYDCSQCELKEFGSVDSRVCAMAYAYEDAVKDIMTAMCLNCVAKDACSDLLRQRCDEIQYLEGLVK